jgi:YidC/Oxa1 family membrane protein insertase
MNAETQALYAKYGVSPTGSCVQLAIQMPILMALYRVIYAVPAYVGKVKDVFMVLVDKLYVQDGIRDYIQTLQNSKTFSKQFTNELFTGNDPTYVKNTIIDVLNRASTSEWKDMVNVYPSLSDQINDTAQKIASFNSFLGLNIANSPSFNVKTGWANRDFLIVLGGIMIPLLAALTQWINTKLMPQPANSQDQSQNQMAQSMKTMNLMMPIMSAFFCYTLPIGMGIYWITGAIIRSIQQIIINKHIDKMDIDAIIEKNADKAKKKLEKKKETAEKMSAYASMNTRSISNKANINNNMSQAEKDEAYNKAMSNASKAKPGSIAAKANMVRDYNDRNNK